MKAGVAILCVMAAVWASWAIGVGHLPPWGYVAAALIVFAPMVAAKGRRFPSSSNEQARRVRWVVGLAILFEVLIIAVGAPVLARGGRPDLMVCLVALAVGLHFFPLARWLPAPKYHLTGSALMIAAGAGLVVPDATSRIVFVAASAAAILWFTALSLVLTLPRSEPQGV